MAPFEFSFLQLVSIGFFGLLIGVFETTTNALFLVTRNVSLPRRQHGMELPEDATDVEVFTKVLQMFGMGLILLSTALLSFIIGPTVFVIGTTAIFLNGLLDYRKFHNKRMFIVWSLLALIAGSLVLL